MSHIIESTEETTIICVETSDGKSYERRGENNWYVWMGESLEPWYSSDELEAAYQQFLKDRK